MLGFRFILNKAKCWSFVDNRQVSLGCVESYFSLKFPAYYTWHTESLPLTFGCSSLPYFKKRVIPLRRPHVTLGLSPKGGTLILSTTHYIQLQWEIHAASVEAPLLISPCVSPYDVLTFTSNSILFRNLRDQRSILREDFHAGFAVHIRLTPQAKRGSGIRERGVMHQSHIYFESVRPLNSSSMSSSSLMRQTFLVSETISY